MLKIAAVGDSLTQNGYPPDLDSCLGASYTVDNFGIGMRAIQATSLFPYQLTLQYANMLASGDDIYVIMFGINDSIAANWNNSTSPARFKMDYLALIAAIKAAKPNASILVMTPHPITTNLLGADPTLVNGIITTLTKEVAVESKVYLLDMNALGDATQTVDGVHPTAAQYTVMANIIGKGLCTLIASTYPSEPRPSC